MIGKFFMLTSADHDTFEVLRVESDLPGCYCLATTCRAEDGEPAGSGAVVVSLATLGQAVVDGCPSGGGGSTTPCRSSSG